jgi:hypothetical protein
MGKLPEHHLHDSRANEVATIENLAFGVGHHLLCGFFGVALQSHTIGVRKPRFADDVWRDCRCESKSLPLRWVSSEESDTLRGQEEEEGMICEFFPRTASAE